MQTAITKQGRRFTGAATGAILLGSAFFLASAYSHATTTTVYEASAYGAEVNVGSAVKLGKVAPALLPTCSTEPTGSYTASAASANYSPLLSIGAVATSATNTVNSSSGVAEITGVDLLAGVISASAVKSVSTTTMVSSGVFQFSAAGTEFTNLEILGLPIAASPAPNTTISLPGIGKVVLNEQVSSSNSEESKLTVNALHVYISANLLGYTPNTEIIIADAASETRSVKGPAVVGGYAQSPELTAGSVKSGPLVYVLIPCEGTSGVPITDSVASVSIPGVLTTGAVTATGTGTITKTETSSLATTSVAGLNLLSGIVGATTITGSAEASTTDGVNYTFTGGATFVGISVAGHPEITDDVKPNTKVALAGLGTLYLNRVETFADYIKVVPVELVVSTASLGLPVGAEVTVGVSEAQLHSATVP